VGVQITAAVVLATIAALVAGVHIAIVVAVVTTAALVAGVQITAAVVLAMTAAVVGVQIAAVVGVQTAAAVVAVDLVAIGNHLCLSRIVKTRTLKRNDKRYEARRNSNACSKPVRLLLPLSCFPSWVSPLR
jgi:hypothetical protein